MSKVITRPLEPVRDSGFIYDTFPKGIYYGSFLDITIPKTKWFSECFEKLKTILEMATTTIAYFSEDSNTILGYAIINGDMIEFIYVKEMYRKQGIATLLLKNKEEVKFINPFNLTKVGQAVLLKHPEYRSK